MTIQADPVNRTSPLYTMTRDGFVFLTMGFTGARAAKFKEAFIQEFNRMEEFICTGKETPAAVPNLNDPVTLRSLLLEHTEKTNALDSKVETFDEITGYPETDGR